MDKPRKPGQPQEVTAHPETQKGVPSSAPGDQSSKAGSKQRDGRTGQDKDGNEQHPQTKRKAG
jgi:hypothetical protein